MNSFLNHPHPSSVCSRAGGRPAPHLPISLSCSTTSQRHPCTCSVASAPSAERPCRGGPQRLYATAPTSSSTNNTTSSLPVSASAHSSSPPPPTTNQHLATLLGGGPHAHSLVHHLAAARLHFFFSHGCIFLLTRLNFFQISSSSCTLPPFPSQMPGSEGRGGSCVSAAVR